MVAQLNTEQVQQSILFSEIKIQWLCILCRKVRTPHKKKKKKVGGVDMTGQNPTSSLKKKKLINISHLAHGSILWRVICKSVWFSLVSVFDGTTTFVVYLIPRLSLWKNCYITAEGFFYIIILHFVYLTFWLS